MNKSKKSKWSYLLMILLAAFTGFGLTLIQPLNSNAAGHRTPPDSYLKTKVYTVDQLIDEIRNDPVIKARYARQFHIAPDKLIAYLRQNVVESYIQKSGEYTVFCVRPNGYMYPASQNFKVGTKVFALRNGQPVMKWICGNPLMKFLPVVNTKVVTKTVPVTITKVSPSIEELIPAQNVEEVMPSQTAIFQPTVPVLISPVTPVTSYLVTGLGSGIGSYVPYIVGAGIIPFTVNHGGTPNTPTTPVTIAPEPTSGLAVALGFVPIAALLGFAKRSISK